MEFDISNRILENVSKEINFNIENRLKIETVNAMERLYILSADKFTKKDIKNIFKDADVEFSTTFPEKISYYYEVNKNPKPVIYSVVTIPFLEDDIKGITIKKAVDPGVIKLPGPFFIEIYSDKKICNENLIDFIAPSKATKSIIGFKKDLKSLPLGIPEDKDIAYKIFTLNKNFTKDDITFLIKTSWHIPPANPYERRAGLIIILFGVLLSIFVARYININFVNPFLKISAASKRVKSGDLNLVLKTGTKQKAVQETYTNFNDMVKGLKEKEELRSGFIRNLTHDLRTPLIAQERAFGAISDKFTELGLEEEKELSKIASGGEMSRIMLAIKSVLADVDKVPILIFDEIDTGISGKAAKAVSEKMRKIANTHQILAITHLASIAAKADYNYYISKIVENEKTKTTVKKLTEEETIEEIARISNGELTKTAIEHAKELRNWKN